MTHLHYVVSFEMIFPEFDGNNKLHDLFYNDKNATYVYLTGSKFSFIALIFLADKNRMITILCTSVFKPTFMPISFWQYKF